MYWDAIGAIGQAVGALALVLVLMQVRHARDEMRRSATLTRLHGSRDVFLLQATEEGQLLSALVHAQTANASQPPPIQQYLLDLGLNRVDVLRVTSYYMAVWQNYEASVESIHHLSPGVSSEVQNSIRGFYANNPIAAKWFELTKAGLNPDAVRYVEHLLMQPNSLSWDTAVR